MTYQNPALCALVADVDFFYVRLCAAVADRTEDTSAVCVRAEHGGFHQAGADNALGDGFGGAFVLCAAHFCYDQLCCALAVGGELFGDSLERLCQRLGKVAVVRVLFGDLGISCQTRRHDRESIVGGGVAVNAHHVVAYVGGFRQRRTEHFG